jgi:hypothetical protein
MMVANLSITKGKVITSGLAGILGALVFLTTIHIAAKIAVIAFAAIATYLVLSIIQKIRSGKNGASAKTKEQSDVSEDEGYDSAGEEKDAVISAEEQEKIEVQKQEELINKRAQERMEQGSLGGPINAFGGPISDKVISTEGHVSVDYREAMVVPKKIVLDDNISIQNNSSSASIPMESLPTHIDAFGNSLSTEQPSTNISMESEPKRKLSPAELLLKWQKDDEKAFIKQHENLIGKPCL